MNYELIFPDSDKNRLTIARFLLGSHFREVPRQVVLDLFNPHAVDRKVAMRIVHKHFVICRDDAVGRG